MSSESESEEYTVEKIIAKKGAGKALRYLVKWEGFEKEEDNTWEPVKNLHPDLVADFERGSDDKAKEAARAAKKQDGPAGGKAADESADEAADADEGDDAAGESDEDASEGSLDEDDEEYEQEAPPPRKSSKQPATSAKRVGAPLTTEKTATAAKRPRLAPAVAVPELGAPLSASIVLRGVRAMDAASIKAFATALGKEGFDIKAKGKKDEIAMDLQVLVDATYERLAVVSTDGAWRLLRTDDPSEPLYSTERLRSVEPSALYRPGDPEKQIKQLEEQFVKASAGQASKAQRKSLGADGKALAMRLSVLEKEQIVDVLLGLVADGSVAQEQVEAKIPAADLDPQLKECRRLVNKIRSSLPNSRWGCSNNAFGYKRCKTANDAAARYMKQAAAGFKKARQWALAKEFCEKALPIAHDMVVFLAPEHNGTRGSVIQTLETLEAEAKQMSRASLVD